MLCIINFFLLKDHIGFSARFCMLHGNCHWESPIIGIYQIEPPFESSVGSFLEIQVGNKYSYCKTVDARPGKHIENFFFYYYYCVSQKLPSLFVCFLCFLFVCFFFLFSLFVFVLLFVFLFLFVFSTIDNGVSSREIHV